MGFWVTDYNKKGWEQLPVWWRQTTFYAWIKVIVSPVIYLAGLFKTNRDKNIYELAHNGQVCHLEAVLNDVFDATDRGIYIDDPAYIDPIYLYQDVELKPVWLGVTGETIAGVDSPVWAYLVSEEYTGGGVQFKVMVPVAVTYDAARMRALVNKYRLVSKKNFTIETY